MKGFDTIGIVFEKLQKHPNVDIKKYITLVSTSILLLLQSYDRGNLRKASQNTPKKSDVEVIISTFLGSSERNYYGNEAPNSLNILWRTPLGSGRTRVGKELKTWSGAGWTGQPLLVNIRGKDFLLQGSNDHSLRMIDAQTGEIHWRNTDFEDVLKATGSIFVDPTAQDDESKYIIIQGCRMGENNTTHDKIIKSLHGVSLLSGKTLWQMNVREIKESHYSRDVDGSGIQIGNKFYIGTENGLFNVLKPQVSSLHLRDNFLQPVILEELPLYEPSDIAKHKGNIVAESSPCMVNNHVYISAGSGHVYGYNLETHVLDFDFKTGSDMDGSAVVTPDQQILVSLEKQYIPGQGGVMKLDPTKKGTKAVTWYFPTQNAEFNTWEGGVIGSVGINTQTKLPETPHFGAFVGMDGWLYVVDIDHIQPGSRVLGPDKKTKYNTPKIVFKYKTGPSISTPIFVKDKLVVAGYGGLFLFSYQTKAGFQLVEKKSESTFEATPIAYNGKLFIASKDGYLYCFGDKK